VNGKVRYGASILPGSTVVWNVTGGTIIKDYNDSVDVQWGSAPGQQTISYREINTFGCSSTEEINYVQLNKPFIDLGTIKQICAGENAILDAGNSFTTYRWNDGSTASSFKASASGIYWVEVTDAAGCSYRDSVTIAVNPIPIVNLAKNITICSPATYPFDAGNPDAKEYLWFDGSTSRYYDAHEGDSIIWVKVSDAIGCSGYDTTFLLICNLSEKIPNAITPDGDLVNDVWRLDLLKSKYPSLQVKIYDRWGRLVFVSERGYNRPWDGTSKGKALPMDTYYYVMDLGNGEKEMVGSVAIIR
jgi:gliding motility-associated-like protein